MNCWEWLVYLGCCALLIGYLRWRFHSWRDAILLFAFCAIPLYLSLEQTSQFLTADENYYVHQLAGQDRRAFIDREIRIGAFRTSLTVLTPLTAMLHRTGEWPAVSATILLKLTHWLTGFLSFLWLLHLVMNLKQVTKPGLFFVVAFPLLLLPVEQLGLKTFNYDVLSMNLGLVTLAYLLLAWQDSRDDLGLLAVVVGTLAAQEKLIASPLLLVAVSVFAWLRAQQRGDSRLVPLVRDTCWALFLAWLICLVSVLVLAVSTGMSLSKPLLILQRAADPLVTWGWGVLRFTAGTLVFSHLFPLLLMLTIGLCVAGSLVLSFVHRRRLFSRCGSLCNFVPLLFLLILMGVLGTGALANSTIPAYWAPFDPIEIGQYHPPGELNGAVLHYRAASRVQHLLCSVGFAYAVFFDSVPTVFWLLSALVVISPSGRKSLVESPLLVAALLVCLLIPLAYGLLQAPLGHRYFNLFLGASALVLLLLAMPALAQASPRLRWSSAVLFLGLFLGEVVPFRPLYGAFHPFWLRFADDHDPQVGRINPCWLGWGEEMMLVGRQLRWDSSHSVTSMDRAPAGPLTLYCCYYSGAWITSDPVIRQVLLHTVTRPEQVSYGPHDYYILNRNMLVQGFSPPDLVPDQVLSFRGFEQAWVYQGQRLAASGYTYDPSRRQFVRQVQAQAARSTPHELKQRN